MDPSEISDSNKRSRVESESVSENLEESNFPVFVHSGAGYGYYDPSASYSMQPPHHPQAYYPMDRLYENHQYNSFYPGMNAYLPQDNAFHMQYGYYHYPYSQMYANYYSSDAYLNGPPNLNSIRNESFNAQQFIQNGSKRSSTESKTADKNSFINGSLNIFTAQDDNELYRNVTKFQQSNTDKSIEWEKIAALMTKSFSERQCQKRWEELSRQSAPKLACNTGLWSQEEDDKLLKIIKELDAKRQRNSTTNKNNKTDNDVSTVERRNLKYFDWNVVSAKMGSLRSPIQCRNRWTLALKPRMEGAKNGSWSTEEDEVLIKAVQDYQAENLSSADNGSMVENSNENIIWTEIAKAVNNRTAVQCRNRWTQSIQPKLIGMKSGGWTAQEDARLVEAIKLFDGHGRGGGIDWKKVSKYVQGRTPKHCVNRWNNHHKGKRQESESKSVLKKIKMSVQ